MPRHIQNIELRSNFQRDRQEPVKRDRSSRYPSVNTEFLACSIDPNIVLEPTYIKQIFGEIDANKDDRITMSEFKNYVSVVVPDHGIQDELFEKMDTHGTGEITLEDFTLVLRNKL